MSIPVIAEIGQAKGSADYAAAAIEAASRAGCWGAKIQLLQPALIAQADAPVYWDERRPEIRGQRDSFATVGSLPYDAVADLGLHAHRYGVAFIVSPFDLTAVDACHDSGVVDFVKIASGDITNEALVRRAAAAFPGRVILSTGASTGKEIARAVGWIHGASHTDPHSALACSLVYPTPLAQAQLGRITAVRRTLLDLGCSGTRIGYSDHTPEPHTSAVAVGAGAAILEKHFTLDRDDPTVPDNGFALDEEDMATYVRAADLANRAMGGQLGASVEETAAWAGARRSLCAARDLVPGEIVNARDLIALRPWDPKKVGADQLSAAVGTKVARPVKAGEALEPRDLSPIL